MDIQIKLDGEPFQITVEFSDYLSCGGLSASGEAYVQSLLNQIENAKQFAAVELLAAYNENWIEDNHSELSQDEFADSLTAKKLVILDEANYGILYFSDGGMFADHWVAVAFSGTIPESAEIEG